MGLNRLGRIIKATGAMQCYRDGDTIGFIWRWWHPLSWLIAPLLFVLYGLTSGFPEAWHRRHDVGLRISPYFSKHPERLEWL